MKLEPLQIEQIELYLQGKLTGNALQEFEAKLQADEAFEKEVKLFRQLFEGIEQKGALDFENQLISWDKEEAGSKEEAPKESKGRVIPMRRFLSAAAVILLLLIPLAWFLLNNKGVSNQQLYANNYETYSDQYRGTTVDNPQSPKALLKEGIDLYFQDSYEASTEKLNAFLSNASDDSSYEQTEAQFYLAMTAQETGNSSKAKLLLNEVVNSKHDYYKADAYWYLSLINLQANDANTAKGTLENLIEQYPSYKRVSKAKKLLRSVQKNL